MKKLLSIMMCMVMTFGSAESVYATTPNSDGVNTFTLIDSETETLVYTAEVPNYLGETSVIDDLDCTLSVFLLNEEDDELYATVKFADTVVGEEFKMDEYYFYSSFGEMYPGQYIADESWQDNTLKFKLHKGVNKEEVDFNLLNTEGERLYYASYYINYILLTPTMANEIIETGKFEQTYTYYDADAKAEYDKVLTITHGLKELLIGESESNSATTNNNTNSTSIAFNGKALNFTLPIINKDDRAYYPMRELLEALGAEVSWDDATKTASGTIGEDKVEFTIGAGTYKVNGEEVTMDAAAFIDSERTYIPIRYAAEGLGFTVGWDEAANTITISK